MSEHLRLVKPHDGPPGYREAGGFASTSIARDIFRGLEAVRSKRSPGIALIAGIPGCGKTMAIDRWRIEEEPELSWKIRAVAGEGRPTAIAEVVFRAVLGGNPNGKSLTRIRTELAEAMVAEHRYLIVDEAQALDADGVEWLRGLCEQAGQDLVLCGDLALAQMRAKLPQLARRTPRPVVIRSVMPDDVAAMIEGTAFASAEAVRRLCEVARGIGGLGEVQSVLDEAMEIAAAAGEAPRPVHLDAAILAFAQDRRGHRT